MSEILASNPGIDCNFVAAVLVAWTKPHCVTYKEHLHKFQFISNLALFASALRCFAACFAFSSSVSSFFLVLVLLLLLLFGLLGFLLVCLRFCSSCSFCLSFLHPWQQVPRSFHSSLSPSWTSWPSHAWSSQHTQRVAGKPALAATEENNTQHEPPEQWMMKSSRNHCRSLTHRSTHPRMQHAFV